MKLTIVDTTPLNHVSWAEQGEKVGYADLGLMLPHREEPSSQLETALENLGLQAGGPANGFWMGHLTVRITPKPEVPIHRVFTLHIRQHPGGRNLWVISSDQWLTYAALVDRERRIVPEVTIPQNVACQARLIILDGKANIAWATKDFADLLIGLYFPFGTCVRGNLAVSFWQWTHSELTGCTG